MLFLRHSRWSVLAIFTVFCCYIIVKIKNSLWDQNFVLNRPDSVSWTINCLCFLLILCYVFGLQIIKIRVSTVHKLRNEFAKNDFNLSKDVIKTWYRFRLHCGILYGLSNLAFTSDRTKSRATASFIKSL